MGEDELYFKSDTYRNKAMDELQMWNHELNESYNQVLDDISLKDIEKMQSYLNSIDLSKESELRQMDIEALRVLFESYKNDKQRRERLTNPMRYDRL